jgi:hypothetical protein
LVASEVSLSVLLLAGAALLITSLARLGSQPLGFQPDGLLTFTLQLPQADYSTDARRIQFHRALLARLKTLPGVEAVGTTSARPLGDIVAAPFTADGPSVASDEGPVWSGQQAVDSDYFRAMRIRVVEGRVFDDHDAERGEPVVIINETLARKYFPGQDPMNRRIKHGTPTQNATWMRVVGVVKDVKHAGLEWDFLPETFVPYSQISGAYAKVGWRRRHAGCRPRCGVTAVRRRRERPTNRDRRRRAAARCRGHRESDSSKAGHVDRPTGRAPW